MHTPLQLMKAIRPSQANSFIMEDITEPVVRRPVQPGLLTAILTPKVENLVTDTFEFDNIEYTSQLPGGKAHGQLPENYVTKDKPVEKFYKVPSFGIHANLTPADIAKRRKLGTSELMSEEDLLLELQGKMDIAWSLHKEKALATLLTTDQNIISGGPHTQYNFYTDLVGTARPAAKDMDLGSTSIDQFIQHQEEKEKLEEELARYGLSAERIAVVCGRTYFNSRLEIEKQEGIARELKGNTKDLVAEMIPSMSDGKFDYSMFESHDGLIYIKYTANIDGKLVGDANAYMVPLGITENLIHTPYSPALTRTYVNTAALEKYTWVKEDEREGITIYEESNCLYMNKRPKAITHLTTSTFQ